MPVSGYRSMCVHGLFVLITRIACLIYLYVNNVAWMKMARCMRMRVGIDVNTCTNMCACTHVAEREPGGPWLGRGVAPRSDAPAQATVKAFTHLL